MRLTTAEVITQPSEKWSHPGLMDTMWRTVIELEENTFRRLNPVNALSGSIPSFLNLLNFHLLHFHRQKWTDQMYRFDGSGSNLQSRKGWIQPSTTT
ncbi:hypothetical protein PROFUN_13683 [Planoprotostelium fungivorum]|uniref:Uncharacterized protein n=1 Tax=Planoprotostelium fungivorum TaxID=1890364 RepID=A0A2P6N3B8_9EUKA|nr:hypothetical protein PROFUN_13683 [Planoprotostelium fungivorum]